ncbi:MAG: TraR/DksA family transcriptional regulator [Gemmatimonadales bacterium]
MRAQYAELRTEVEQELRRLIPGQGSQLEAGSRNARRASVPESDGGPVEALRELAPRVRRRALQLLEVLRRMDTQTFGVCVGCRSPIPYERLAAIPETTVCVECSWSREFSFRR